MSKSTTVIIIYVLGLVVGALFFDLWGAETSIKKGLIGIGSVSYTHLTLPTKA